MTTDEAIYILKNTAFLLPSRGGSIDEVDEAIDMAIEALEEQRWIPCSERLPEKETHWYLVCSPHGQMKVDWWHCNDGRWDWRYMFEPIAWMPLPEPYAGRRTDE